MGTYYRIVNLDKREMIDLYQVTAIKSPVFAGWSLQTAVLNTFLGFSWPGYGLDLGEWVGRWADTRVSIRNDNTEYSDDEPEDYWPDAGMEFLCDLRQRGRLDAWISIIHWTQYWGGMDGNAGLDEWLVERRGTTEAKPE